MFIWVRRLHCQCNQTWWGLKEKGRSGFPSTPGEEFHLEGEEGERQWKGGGGENAIVLGAGRGISSENSLYLWTKSLIHLSGESWINPQIRKSLTFYNLLGVEESFTPQDRVQHSAHDRELGEVGNHKVRASRHRCLNSVPERAAGHMRSGLQVF